jgi:putative ABC transport system permease protein
MLRERPASVIATFVALFVATAVVTACGVMLESGIRYHGQVQRYAAAPVLIATTNVHATSGSGEDRETESAPLTVRGSLPTSLPDEIAAVPGVRAAVADVAAPGTLMTPSGSAAVEVHPWSAAQLGPFRLKTGSAPTPDTVVLDQTLADTLHARRGELIRISTATGVRSLTVAGTTTATGTPTVFAADADAAQIAGRGPQVIGVFPEPGVSTKALANDVRAALPPRPDGHEGAYPQVFTGAERGSVESPDVANGRTFVIAVSSSFGGCTLLIAIFVIAGTVGLSVKQRHHDIALLRAIAATPRQVRRLMVRETVALALLAGASGVWAGRAGSAWLRDQFVSRGMVPSTFHVHASWIPPLVAIAAAVLIAATAAWIASLRASRLRPTVALTETVVDRTRVGVIRSLFGLIALVGGITLAAVSARVTGDSAAAISVATVFALTTAVALLSPLLIRVTAATVGRILLLFGVTGRLAVATTRTSARRLSAVLSALVLAVALGGSLWFVETSAEHVAHQQVQAGLLADEVVTPQAPGLRPDLTATLRGTPGVTAAVGVTHGTLFSPHDGPTDYSVQGIDPAGLGRTVDLDVTSGSITGLRGNTVAVDTLTAQALHLHVGSTFNGWFGDGTPAHLRVIAIYQRGLGFAPFTVAADVLLPHTASGLLDAVFVRTDKPTALATELARVAPGATLVPRSAYQTELDQNLVQNGWTNRMITAVLMIYVIIAAANSLIMYALGRRREFAVLRLTGTTRAQVRNMVRLEQLLLLGVALVLGVTIAAATLLPMVKGITGSVSPSVPAAGWVAVIGGVFVLGGVATMPPVRRVLRMRPVDAIGVRE